MLHQGVTLLELIHRLLRQPRCRGWEGHTRCHHRGDGSGGGAQRLTQVNLRAQGRHQRAELACIGPEAFGLEGVGEGPVHGITHAPRVVMGGDARVRRSHRERVPTREGGRRHGSGEGQGVAAEGIRIRGLRVGGPGLEAVELVEQVLSCLSCLSIDPVAAGCASVASWAATSVAATSTTAAVGAAARIAATTATAAASTCRKVQQIT